MLVAVYDFWRGGLRPTTIWENARLVSVTVVGSVISLTVQARPGQTGKDITGAASAIGAACGATSVTSRVLSPSTALIELVMTDYLTGTRLSGEPVGRPRRSSCW